MKIPNIPGPYVFWSAIGTGFGCVFLIKDYMGGDRYPEDVKIYGKTVIITGANSGIGKATAMDLAKRGGRILMACRDMEKCEVARGEIVDYTTNPNVHCRHLDLASIESVKEFADKINKEEKRLDVLINNAGVMNCPKSVTKDGFEMQLGTNYLGHFLLTNLLLDKMKQFAHARIINLTSPVYAKSKINFDDLNSLKSYDPNKAYGQSKLALVLFTRELSRRLEGTNITVNCVYPGLANSDIGRHMAVSKSKISGGILSPFYWLFLKTTDQACQTVTYCAINPDLETVSGKYFKYQSEKPIYGSGLNDEVAKRLWLVSEKWTRLK